MSGTVRRRLGPSGPRRGRGHLVAAKVLAAHHGRGRVEVRSAGSRPSEALPAAVVHGGPADGR